MAGFAEMVTISGGSKLAHALAEISRNVTDAHEVKVGFFGGATEPDGTPVALVAAINEFGAPSRGQPPRPFFRNMIAAKSKGWGPATAELLKANNYDAEKTLQLVGEGIAGQLRQSIIDTNSPPLAASTVKRKGFDKPLIDTGTMIKSIGVEVS